MKKEYLAGLAVGLMTCMVGSAQASSIVSVIDFEDLASPDELTGAGSSYSSQGYIFSYASAPGEPYPVGFTVVGTTWQFNTGSTALLANSARATATLTRDDAQAYSFIAVDLAELNGPGVTSVQFDGLTLGGLYVSQTFNLDGLVGFEHFSFSDDFASVISVTWIQGDVVNFMPHMFDNVAVATSSVPAPSALWLIASGFGGLVSFKRRKN